MMQNAKSPTVSLGAAGEGDAVALDDGNGKYRLLFEASEDPMWLIVGRKFENCNDAAVKVLGYESQEELKSTHPSQLSPEYQPDGQTSFDKAEQMMATAVNKGYHRFEWIHRRKNGEDFPVEVTLTKIPFEEQDAIYCVWRDISARKTIEEELRVAREDAEHANRHKSEFLTMMSHELRTPLNAVLGFSEFLARGFAGDLSEKQAELAHNIHNGGRLLLSLVEDLLNMSRIEQGHLDLQLEKLSVSEVLLNAARIAEPLAQSKGVELIVDDAQKAKCVVQADAIRLEQIIVNLLSNAIKYNRRGGHVRLGVGSCEGDSIRIVVKDDGPGVLADQKNNIFQPFNRGGKEASGIEGTGLGLPICRSLAEAMSGTCDFESVPDKETCFWVELPRVSEVASNK